MMRALFKQARPKQWLKNVLVFAAVGAAGKLHHWPYLWRTIAMFVAFSLAASGTYYWNDILDVEDDRRHPEKRRRPIASGVIPMPLARIVGSSLLIVGVALPIVVWRWQAVVAVAVYVALTLAYSLQLRRLAVFDLVAVAGGFVLRAIGGAEGTAVYMSKWFLLCTMFGSLFVVAGKRYAELRELGADAPASRASLENYSLEFLRQVLTVSCGATLLSYCVWAFDTGKLHDARLPLYELTVAPMLVALLRYVLVLESGRGGAPEEVFYEDRPLQFVGLVWAVTFALAVYLGNGTLA